MEEKINQNQELFSLLGKNIFCLFLLFLIFSCADKPQYLQFKDIQKENWSMIDTLHFTVSGENFTGKKPSVLIRHSNRYAFQNIWLKVGPNTDSLQRVEIMLANIGGQWLGNKSGSLYTSEYVLEKFPLPADTSTISIIQNMRANPLVGVQAVGIKVE